MVKVAVVKMNHNQTAIWIHRLSHPDPRMYQTVKAAAAGEVKPRCKAVPELATIE
jgi:hypothetical protein